uniref:Uncharacterized protein n=1 Tax=viral metagenome TaxID=1070528 RepID=A0A6M3X6C3_9ZZZZ
MSHMSGPYLVVPAKTGAAYEILPDQIPEWPVLARVYRQRGILGAQCYDAKGQAELFKAAPNMFVACQLAIEAISSREDLSLSSAEQTALKALKEAVAMVCDKAKNRYG